MTPLLAPFLLALTEDPDRMTALAQEAETPQGRQAVEEIQRWGARRTDPLPTAVQLRGLKERH